MPVSKLKEVRLVATGTEANILASEGFGGELAIATDTGNLFSCKADGELFTRQPKSLKDWSQIVNNIGSIGGGTQDIDFEDGNVVAMTVDTSETTLTISNPPASGEMGILTLIITNGGSQTLNWPGTVLWPDGIPPGLTASGVDLVQLLTTNGGTSYLGIYGGLNFS